MSQIVFEAGVMIPNWTKEWRHYYLSDVDAANLIATLPEECKGIIESVDELRDLLSGTGVVSTRVALSGNKDEVMKMLTAMAKAAWKNSVPWDVDETEFMYKGDEKFGRYLRAYVQESGN